MTVTAGTNCNVRPFTSAAAAFAIFNDSFELELETCVESPASAGFKQIYYYISSDCVPCSRAPRVPHRVGLPVHHRRRVWRLSRRDSRRCCRLGSTRGNGPAVTQSCPFPSQALKRLPMDNNAGGVRRSKSIPLVRNPSLQRCRRCLMTWRKGKRKTFSLF